MFNPIGFWTGVHIALRFYRQGCILRLIFGPRPAILDRGAYCAAILQTGVHIATDFRVDFARFRDFDRVHDRLVFFLRAKKPKNGQKWQKYRLGRFFARTIPLLNSKMAQSTFSTYIGGSGRK